jgi:Lar family restriction alleviation protein
MKLKPCPFCGEEAELTEYGNLFVGISKTVVRCKNCNTKQEHRWLKLKFDISKIEELTIEAWNKRKGEPNEKG